jgi:leucyl aminopeptidase
VNVSWTADRPEATDADTVVVGLFEGEEPREGIPVEQGGTPEQVGELVASGEAQRSFKALAVTHAEGKRWLAVGLGPRDEFTPERARVVAAAALERAREISTKTLCWQVPSGTGTGARTGAGKGTAADAAAGTDAEVAGALVEGTVLTDYRFERYKSAPKSSRSKQAGKEPPKHLERLIVAAPGAKAPKELERAVAQAAVVAQAVNEARDLQNRPGNDLTPSALAEYARALGAEIEGLTVETEGRKALKKHGMGAFAAVAQGSEQEPALVTLRYSHPKAKGPLLGLVGKAVTFDSGGISLKPGAKMAEMKFDMSGGAAVLSAVAAIARLKLPVRLVAVVGATENLPDGRAVKPGDIVTAANGRTIEVNNTDAEGRLVLADCLCHAVSLGAERIVDLATLTGAVIVALGSTYAGLLSNDEEWSERVREAGARTGEIVWRLPLHEEYDELIKGQYGDLDNAPEARKAGTILGAAFLSNFVGDIPWAHLDIAGSAWDLGRAYAPKGAAGYGVRLLVELARGYC